MPVHDWSLVEDGIFHDFHNVWLGEIRSALNDGMLPSDYYALVDQHAGRHIPDILTLRAPAQSNELPSSSRPRDDGGGLATLQAPPVQPISLSHRASRESERRSLSGTCRVIGSWR